MTTAFWVVVVFLLLGACKKTSPEHIDINLEEYEIPKIYSLDVSTVISDSGITRYRINTPQWDVYDDEIQPYWEFPYGVHFERFDEELSVDANIHCEYAKFLEKENCGIKRDVRATNIEGELFETEQLFWNQQTEKVYSDSTIKITQENYIIIGKGFESNQSMTKYQVQQTQGVIPVNE